MKVLVGVDDSPHSNAALDFVKRMAWPANTKVIVVTAAPPVYAMVDMGGATYLQAAQEQSFKEHEELAARVERDLKNAGFQTSARVAHADPREALVEAARVEGADLLVVGSHGRTGLEKLLMGSVASHVVTHAPCSVLVVKLPKK